jgi:hypothetical protein
VRDARFSERYQAETHTAVEAGIAFKGDELRVEVQTERNNLVLLQAQQNKPESNAENRRKVAAELKEDRATEMEGTSRENKSTSSLWRFAPQFGRATSSRRFLPIRRARRI